MGKLQCEEHLADTDDDRDQWESRFRRLYETNFRLVQAYTVNRVGFGNDVADIVAEVFTAAWRRLADIPPPPGDRFWLYGTARRIIARRHRSASRLRNLVARLAASQRTDDQPLARAEDPAHERRRRFVVSAVSGAAVAGVTAAVALALIPGSPVALDTPDTAAAAVLGHAAVTAGRQPAGTVAGPGQYTYAESLQENRMESQGQGTSVQKILCVQTVQDWVAPDGSGRQVASMPSYCHGAGIPHFMTFSNGQLLADGLLYSGVADLPTEPATLEHFIVQHFEGGVTQAGATFQFGGTFLQPGAPPAVRAALYRLIGSLPGVQSLGPMNDELGRHGIGVGFTQYGVRDVLIFDPATSAVLEREGVVVNPSQAMAGLPAGAVIDYTVYVASGVVNSITAVPPAVPR